MNHYELLGLAPTAEPSVIRAAYRARVAEVHPDLAKGPADEAKRTAATAALNEAHRVLADPVLRQEYDSTRARQEPAFTRTEHVRRSPSGVPLRTPPPPAPGKRSPVVPRELGDLGRWLLVDSSGQWVAMAVLGLLSLLPLPLGGSPFASLNLFLSLGLVLAIAQGIASRRLTRGPLGLLVGGLKRLLLTLSPIRIR